MPRSPPFGSFLRVTFHLTGLFQARVRGLLFCKYVLNSFHGSIHLFYCEGSASAVLSSNSETVSNATFNNEFQIPNVFVEFE